MLFSTQFFLFVYFPFCLAAYYAAVLAEKLSRVSPFLKRLRAKDLILILASLGFYMWAGVADMLRLLVYIQIVFLSAVWIEAVQKSRLALPVARGSGDAACKRWQLAALPLILTVGTFVFILGYYKYYNLITSVWNWFFKDGRPYRTFTAPLGISFITFSAVSYLVDVYREKAPRGSWVDCALYIVFFPKVISGPIVLWQDFQPQLCARRHCVGTAAAGLRRIMTGLAKKVILADSFGACLASIGTSHIDQITAWGAMLLYMMQIYYDFSGYSDIAIGLSGLFGFDVKENFDFPYRSLSMSEFWRRWHISLGTWFREYIYIPLGGNRKGRRRTLVNLAVVFAVTGIWHGAGLNYLLWGVMNGLLVIIERVISDKPFYRRVPKCVRYAGTMLSVLLLWQFFRFSDLHDALRLFAVAAGVRRYDIVYYTWRYLLDARTLVFLAAAVLGATALGSPSLKRLAARFTASAAGAAAYELVLFALFILSILFMVNSTYSPFIYFQY